MTGMNLSDRCGLDLQDSVSRVTQILLPYTGVNSLNSDLTLPRLPIFVAIRREVLGIIFDRPGVVYGAAHVLKDPSSSDSDKRDALQKASRLLEIGEDVAESPQEQLIILSLRKEIGTALYHSSLPLEVDSFHIVSQLSHKIAQGFAYAAFEELLVGQNSKHAVSRIGEICSLNNAFSRSAQAALTICLMDIPDLHRRCEAIATLDDSLKKAASHGGEDAQRALDWRTGYLRSIEPLSPISERAACANLRKLLAKKDLPQEELVCAIRRLRGACEPESVKLLRDFALGRDISVSTVLGFSFYRYPSISDAARAAAFGALDENVLNDRQLRGAALLFLTKNTGTERCRDYLDLLFTPDKCLDGPFKRSVLTLIEGSGSETAELKALFATIEVRALRREGSYLERDQSNAFDHRRALRIGAIGIGREEQDRDLQGLDYGGSSDSCPANIVAEMLARLSPVELVRAKCKWMPFSEMVRHVRDLQFELSKASYLFISDKDPLDYLRASPSDCKKVEEAVISLNDNQPLVRFYSHGAGSLILLGYDGRIIKVRINDPELAKQLNCSELVEPPRVEHPAILKPYEQILDAGPFKVERMRKLNTEGVTEDQLSLLSDVLKESGLILLKTKAGNALQSHDCPGDIRAVNVGLLPDGTPIIFDSERIRAPEGWKLKFSQLLSQFVDAKGRWKQDILPDGYFSSAEPIANPRTIAKRF